VNEVIMNEHLYLRAYMAGIAVPTALLLVGLTVFCLARFVFNVPAPIERLLVFPLAIVPNAFGAWNMLYVALRARWQTPIGLHGAVLPFFLAPIGFALASSLGFLRVTDGGLVWLEIVRIPFWCLTLAPFMAVAIYYLVWKYGVGFLNRVLGIA
jgi:hypothetical protein